MEIIESVDFEKMQFENEIKKRVEINKALKAGDEKQAAEIINFMCGNLWHEQQRMLKFYADDFKDPEILYDLILEVYTNDGYDFPKKLIQLAKKLSKQVPEEKRLDDMPEGDPVTIYRGTSGIATRTDISWTTDITVAVWFANRYGLRGGKIGNVYKGIIARDKIIAYTNCRNESEVIQHMNVQNISKMTFSDEEWKRYLSEREKYGKQWNEKMMESWKTENHSN